MEFKACFFFCGGGWAEFSGVVCICWVKFLRLSLHLGRCMKSSCELVVLMYLRILLRTVLFYVACLWLVEVQS